MKTNMYEAYIAAKNAVKSATPTARGPIAARQLNVTHDPVLLTAKDGSPYTVINGYDAKNTPFKVLAFRELAEELVATVTKGDFVEFVGRQQDIPEEFGATAKTKLMLNANDRGSFKVLSSSQEKAVAREERLAAKAKVDQAFQAKAPSALQVKVQGAYLSRD